MSVSLGNLLLDAFHGLAHWLTMLTPFKLQQYQNLHDIFILRVIPKFAQKFLKQNAEIWNRRLRLFF